MYLKIIPKGMLESNCYILGANGEAAVIDPGADVREISKVLEEQRLTLKYIILTHAHIDHILNVDELKEACGSQVVIHKEDAPLLANPILNGSLLFGSNKVFQNADLELKDLDTLMLGNSQFLFLHTPGHTPGGMCIRIDNSLFTGDTLFRRSIGRTDLGAGNPQTLTKSLRRLITLEDTLQIYPGHGPSSTIAYEKHHNPYLSNLQYPPSTH